MLQPAAPSKMHLLCRRPRRGMVDLFAAISYIINPMAFRWNRWNEEHIESHGVDPSEEERAELDVERARLRSMEGLLAAAGGGAEAIAASSGDGGVAQLLAECEQLAGAVQGVDPQLDELASRLAALRIEAEDLGGELRRYADSLEAEPGRLQEVEERLEQYDRLERKHGGSVAAVLEHAERCRAERDRLEQAEVATERAEAELATAVSERASLAAELGRLERLGVGAEGEHPPRQALARLPGHPRLDPAVLARPDDLGGGHALRGPPGDLGRERDDGRDEGLALGPDDGQRERDEQRRARDDDPGAGDRDVEHRDRELQRERDPETG